MREKYYQVKAKKTNILVFPFFLVHTYTTKQLARILIRDSNRSLLCSPHSYALYPRACIPMRFRHDARKEISSEQSHQWLIFLLEQSPKWLIFLLEQSHKWIISLLEHSHKGLIFFLEQSPKGFISLLEQSHKWISNIWKKVINNLASSRVTAQMTQQHFRTKSQMTQHLLLEAKS